MSQIARFASIKLNQFIKKSKNRTHQSTSSQPVLAVGDSRQTFKGTVTNVTAGTFMCLIALFALATLPTADTHATASSITITPSSVSTYVNIPPTAEGKFAATGTVTYGITTTHASGYTASVSATDLSFVDTAGINGTVDATYTIAPLATGTAITAAQFAASEGTAYTNKWGYLPSTYYNPSTSATVTNNDKYFPAPIGTTQKLDETNIANPSTPNNYDITVGARVDHTLEQGAYTTTITVSAVGNPTPYTVHYYANVGSDTISDMPGTPTTDPSTGEVMSTITKEAIGATDTIDTASPHRTASPSANTAYLFSGWCTARTTVDGGCGGTQYTIAGEYAIDQTASTNELTLYAMWRTDPCYNETNLHNLVACQVKTDGAGSTASLTERTQTLAQMQAIIGEPVSDSPYADTSNSGVYKYDATTFGAASDATNTSDIYYFRGILDGDYAYYDDPNGEHSGVPSSGDSAYYQNFVKLSTGNTCWRIVRTTGSGGVKMIYNGTWDSTNNTCARWTDSAQIGSTYFNRGGPNEQIAYAKISPNTASNSYSTRGFAVYVGYNYNSDYGYVSDPLNTEAHGTKFTTNVANSTLFKNTNSTNNITESNLKTTIENWYDGASNLGNYESKLEGSAGWCNDRTTIDTPSSSDTTLPYGAGTNFDVYGGITFGAAQRNVVANKHASLECLNVTGEDLLTTGNNFLNVPIAPLVEDEVAFAGHGYPIGSYPYVPTRATTYSSNWSYRSFLRSGFNFWLLSPLYRGHVDGDVGVFYVNTVGWSGIGSVSNSIGVRPSISLTSSTTISSGSGTSTDPWIITP